jgi:hypothetical protein
MIKESYKNRIKKLAGLISEEEVKLSANTGRSDDGTLSWYSENYLLDLGSKILSELDNIVEKDNSLTLKLLKSSTKMNANSLFISLSISGYIGEKEIDENFEITLSVQFSNDSNTVSSVNYRGVTNRFNLNSKHSSDDLKMFVSEVTDNIMNSIKLSNLNPKS